MTTPSSTAAKTDWRSPAIVILCGCIMATLSFGPRSALGFFLLPISEANGWTRDTLSLTMAIQNLMWGVGQPFMGAIADRFGTLRVFWAGTVMYAAGLLLMTLPIPVWLMHIGSGVLVGFGLAGVSFNLVLAAFNKILPEKQRSMAAGAGTAAGSFGQFLFAPLTVGLMSVLSWQSVMIVFAGIIMVIIPLAFAVKSEPNGAAVAGSREQSVMQSLSEAFRHPSYVFLVIGFFTCGFQLAFITSHMPAYLSDMKIAPWVGGYSLALIGAFNILGSLTAGWLSSRMSKPWLLCYIYFGRAIAGLLFVLVPISTASVLVFSATMGFLWLSTVPPTSGLVALMFGTRYMAMLYGFAFFSHQVGGFLGVYLGGYVYQQTGSYDLLWWASVALAVGSALINIPVQEKPAPRLAAAQPAQ